MTETITMDDSGAVFSLVNEGRAALERRRSDEAVAAFLAALELEPHNAELHNNLGYALSLQSRNQTRGQGLNSKVSERALESFHEALRLRPADRTIIENLAAFLEHVEANNDIIRLLLEQSQHTPWWGDLYFEAGKAMAAERALHSRSAEVPRRIVVDGTALRMWQTALRLGSAKAHVLMAQVRIRVPAAGLTRRRGSFSLRFRCFAPSSITYLSYPVIIIYLVTIAYSVIMTYSHRKAFSCRFNISCHH